MTDPLEHRVLVLAPTGRDAANTERLLTRAGFAVHLSQDAPGLCAEVARGAGAVLLTEEALTRDTDGVLPAMLLRQPAWSDLPFIVLTAGGPDSPGALHATQTLGNVILLERPVRVSTCVVAARTALRARERQYQTRALLAELRDADRRKDEFLAMLAHELRNPLAPLRNAADLLKLLAFSRDELQGVEDVVDRQVTALTRLVDDLLDVSRITRGKIELRRERISVAELLARAVELSQPLLDSRSHQLQVNVPAQELWLDGDLTRLTQVLANLLNNAAKYTPEGGHVRLTVGREGGEAVVRVADTGVGIPA
ncbi:MAG TPA: HAMP domain-containing sensor histidine kinase, partial [Candidatus Binatia bacterium]|nr:HAMP domain-containing sensor histidine kinase [Candidatus Binatia bacterium]